MNFDTLIIIIQLKSFFKYPTCTFTTTYSNYFNFCPRSMESKRKSAIKLEFKCVSDSDLSTAGPPQMYGIKWTGVPVTVLAITVWGRGTCMDSRPEHTDSTVNLSADMALVLEMTAVLFNMDITSLVSTMDITFIVFNGNVLNIWITVDTTFIVLNGNLLNVWWLWTLHWQCAVYRDFN